MLSKRQASVHKVVPLRHAVQSHSSRIYGAYGHEQRPADLGDGLEVRRNAVAASCAVRAATRLYEVPVCVPLTEDRKWRGSMINCLGGRWPTSCDLAYSQVSGHTGLSESDRVIPGPELYHGSARVLLALHTRELRCCDRAKDLLKGGRGVRRCRA
jgi:hypothetical protein